MRLIENVYQTSGVIYGTNSSTYCIDTSKGLVLIDAGFSEKQYDVMRFRRKQDDLGTKKIRDVFLTHSHFDHAGNSWLLQQNGAKVYVGADDAEALEKADERTLSDLFGRKFHAFTPDGKVRDGQTFDYGNTQLTVLEHPGHTEGTITILAETNGKKILFAGDIFVLKACNPADELQPEIGWTGGPDYNGKKNLETFRKLKELPPVDLVAPGHGSIYFGDSRKLFEILYHLAEKEAQQ